MQQRLTVAVPWSLSHYIPLGGFDTLYRALFDHAPENVSFSAWDNVKLYGKLHGNASVRRTLVDRAKREEYHLDGLEEGSIARRYKEYFWPPNQVLTAALEGGIELHHTAPFPSLKRPFVFHCESFAPILFPFAQQGSGDVKRHEELREHYRGLFAHPFCLGIFSHVPDTLHALQAFLSEPAIDGKLFFSRAGLSADTFLNCDLEHKPSLSRPRFLFFSSADQNPANIFRRGGHLVLRFWKEFISEGRDGLLIMRCAKPSDIELCEHGVDLPWVQSEIGRSIIWDQGYLAGYEMHSLIGSAHFVLLPSASLPAVSIMEAMRAGTIPVVSDSVGTSAYVTDEEYGIVLHGVRKKVWQKDQPTGVLAESCCRRSELERFLVEQMTGRVCKLLDDHGAYWEMRRRTIAYARKEFSGRRFAEDFWSTVSDLYSKFSGTSASAEIASDDFRQSLNDCTILNHGWVRAFESSPQPMLRIRTGFGMVWELGGAIIQTSENPRIGLNDWSVLAQYYKGNAPPVTYADTLEELEGTYLHPLGGRDEGVRRRLVRWISNTLRPFPALYDYAARVLAVYRRHGGLRFVRPKARPEIELVRHGVTGYDIIRHRDRYYAILQHEGEFSPEKAEAGGYSSCYRGHSVDEVLGSIAASISASKVVTCEEDAESNQVVVEGFHNFNIVRKGKEFYAVLRNESELAQSQLLSKPYPPAFSGLSPEEVRRKILSALTTESAWLQDWENSVNSIEGPRRGTH
jgi:glycosyltransferase involved in cell wall biosynthesis